MPKRPRTQDGKIIEGDSNSMWSKLEWEPVNVGDNSGDGDVYNTSTTTTTEDGPGNAVFFGLEVIDGSKYKVVNNKVIPAVSSVMTEEKKIANNNDTKKESSSDTKEMPSNDTRKERQKLKRKAKNERKKKKKAQQHEPSPSLQIKDAATTTTLISPDTIRSSWSLACQSSIWLHPVLSEGLASLQFMNPTPIQAATLPASILGRRNIVGAAPTGSGKTLAYGLPILQLLLEELDTSTQNNNDNSDNNNNNTLRALITCPTRELTMQVSKELRNVCQDKIKIGTIVGGLSEQKQKRVLDKVRPPILVATPGRLWELIHSEEHSHLQNLNNLRFLVIDEADRMISQGNFPQLTNIFDHIQRNTPDLEDNEDSDGDEESDDDDDDDRLRSLQGVRGEAKVVMMDPSLMEQIQQQVDDSSNNINTINKNNNTDDNSADDEASSTNTTSSSIEEEEDRVFISEKIEKDKVVLVPRQTFVYSATLTLPSALQTKSSKTTTRSKRNNHLKTLSVQGAIAEIMERAGATGPTKVVDLTTTTTTTNTSSSTTASTHHNSRLPPGLSLSQIECTQMHKDSHCYAYLATTRQGSSGPCLIFCNSIVGVRRVGATLQALGLPVRTLHAQMAQKQRFSALESLKKGGSRAIVVATDVAARGLDIPSVSTVIHYDVARAVDTFIHRAGRTARGVGEKAVGCSISLVASGEEERKHKKICEAVLPMNTNTSSYSKAAFPTANIDVHLLTAAQVRTALATKVVSYEESEARTHKSNRWFVDAAKEADIDIDDEDVLEDGLLNNGSNRDHMQAREALQAKAKLKQLLMQPMRKQNFGKFLAGPGMAAAVRMENQVSPYVVAEGVGQMKKNGRKRRKKM